MAHVLNEELEEGNNNDILSMLLNSGVDPNDFRESMSPLIIAYQTENIEAFDLLLYYGADPNVDEGNGLTIFTSIIHLILNDITYHRLNQDVDHYNYIIKQLLLNGASMNIGNPTAYKYISDWSSMYSDNALLGIRDENDIESQQIMRQLIENIQIEIIDELEEELMFDTYLTKKRSSVAKSQLPNNIMENVFKYLDNDMTIELGETLLDDNRDMGGYDRYDSKETYKDYKKKKQKKTKKKRYKQNKRENKRMAEFIETMKEFNLISG